MGRLIDADELLTHIEDYGEGQYRLDLIAPYYVHNAPTVEAIPKADYEARLKADIKAILVELQLEIECCEKSDCDYASSDCLSQWQIDILIQQKINALKGEEDGCNN